MKKIRAVCQTFKNAVFFIAAKFTFCAVLLSNKSYQTFRFMCIQTVAYESPGCPGCFYLLKCELLPLQSPLLCGGIQIWLFHTSYSGQNGCGLSGIDRISLYYFPFQNE